MMARIKDAKEDVKKLIKQYDKMGAALVEIYRAAADAGLDTSKLSTWVDAPVPPSTSPTVKKTSLDKSVKPQSLAQDLIKGYDIKESGYDEELKKEEKNAEHEHHGLTGVEAIIAVYKAYAKNFQNLSDDEAEDAAHALFSRQIVDKSLVDTVNETINHDMLEQEMGKKPNGMLKGLFRMAVTETLTGREDKFVSNLAYASGIKETSWSGNRLQPKWKNASYRKLINSYYSLRESVRAGHLSNSRYVRRQLDEVGDQLVTRFASQIIIDSGRVETPDAAHGGHGDPKEGEKKEGADHGHDHGHGKESRAKEIAKQAADIKTATRTLLIGEVPASYQQDVSNAVKYADENTAPLRRWIGRKVLGTASGTKSGVTGFFGKSWEHGGWYNPIRWAGTTWRTVGREKPTAVIAGTVGGLAFGLPGAIGGAIGGPFAMRALKATGRGIKRLWDWSGTESSGHGHGHDAGHGHGGGGGHH